MKKVLIILVVFCACKKDKAPDETAPPPVDGMYVTSQFKDSDLTMQNNVLYSRRPNLNGTQYTADNRKAQEAGDDELELLLDVIVPPNATASAKQPLVVIIHGGSFSAGSKEDDLPTATSYAKAGYVAATINYRLTPGVGGDIGKSIAAITQAAEDGMNAIRFLKSKKDQYHIDVNRVATVGYSAGGGISLINAISFDALINTTSDFTGITSKVQAAASTGATLVQPGLDRPEAFLKFDKDDSPIILFHANPLDGSVGTKWNDHVIPTQKLITDAGSECLLVAQPDRTHTVDLSLGGPYWKDLSPFLWAKLKLAGK